MRSLAQQRAAPFTAREIDLVASFADQAVIAIQNARLFNDTREALEQQTATAEVLRIISQSPNEIQPVFRAIVDTALALFRVDHAGLIAREGDAYRVMAVAVPGRPAGIRCRIWCRSTQADFPSRAILGRTMVHVPDWTALELPLREQQICEKYGFRSSPMLPIMRGSECIGGLGILPRRSGPLPTRRSR